MKRAVLVIALTLLPQTAFAEPPRGVPWVKSSIGQYTTGWQMNCGPTHDDLGAGQWDKFAVDLMIDGSGSGGNVATMADGLVAYRSAFEDEGWGFQIIINHGGHFSRYAHFQSPSTYLSEGNRVRAGQKIGTEGGTGGSSSFSPHLHFQFGRLWNLSSALADVPEPLAGEYNSVHQAMTGLGSETTSCANVDEINKNPWGGSTPISDVLNYNIQTGGDFSLYHGDGDGYWGSSDTGTTLSNANVVTGQFTNDAAADMFVYDNTFGNGQWRLLRSSATGLVPYGDGGQSSWLYNATVYPGQFNADSRTDLFISRSDGQFRFWLNNGDGTFAIGQTDTFNIPGWPAVIGRFNDDLFSDVARFDPSGTNFAIWTGNGSNGITNTYYSAFNFPGKTLFGQFDADRLGDLIRYSSTGNSWQVRRSNTSGQLIQGWTGTWTGPPGLGVIGQFDPDDNKADILRFNGTVGTWSLERSNGAGGWAHSEGTIAAGMEILVASFNGDMVDDILIAPTAGYGNTGNTRMGNGVGGWGPNVSWNFPCCYWRFIDHFNSF